MYGKTFNEGNKTTYYQAGLQRPPLAGTAPEVRLHACMHKARSDATHACARAGDGLTGLGHSHGICWSHSHGSRCCRRIAAQPLNAVLLMLMGPARVSS